MVDEQARSAVAALNEALGDAPYKVDLVDPAELVPAEKNARFMTNEQFTRLVRNVATDGGLSSVPLCWWDGERYHILSGHHRTRSAIEAKLKQILILYTDKEMSTSERLAVQLSHNAIAGQDDATLLRELWENITEIDAKSYSGLDDKQLDALNDVTLPPLSPATLDYRQLTFLFLPSELTRLEETFDRALETVSGKNVRVARHAEWDRLLDGMSKVSDSYDVRNGATTLMLVLDVFEKHQTDLAEGWEGPEDEPVHKGWVPLASIFGGDRVPAGAAMTIKRALSKMLDAGDVSEKASWQFIEFLAAEYLAGAEGGGNG
jgi:hypothetical protein